MRVLIVTVPKADFTEQMNSMRIWLDENRITPTRFEYDDQPNGMIAIRVTFDEDKEADLFAKRFLSGC
jgi:outer membrane lipoprotein-sorting protein